MTLWVWFEQNFHIQYISWQGLRQRNLLGILLEFLKYQIFLERDGNRYQKLKLMTLEWMVRIVIVMMIVRMKMKVLLRVPVCSYGRLHTKDVSTVFAPCHKIPIYVQLGLIQVWDLSSHLNALAETETEGVQGVAAVFTQDPLHKFKHKDEGYAIDWSLLVPGRLVSGDCDNSIYLWEPTSAGTWNVDNAPFTGHTGSVEDLQWSPTEPHVFASCSVDGNIAIWDIRLGKSPAASFKAHNADVNVISWNRLASCMLASGSDDGTISIRDLRLLKEGDSLVAHFEYHKHPITSIEWSPHEASSLAVSSADNQLTIWDLSLEKDEEEEAEFKAKTREQVNAPEDLPPQLLFIHQGQKDLKELHWHAQIPGMIVSTAADGFNILMPSNIQSTSRNYIGTHRFLE
ncbi:protein HEAT STRESS TOLERANT DWD 1-like isoform X2 [Vigna umbellata]|uniref:protein HEAT STRESS TOLERANT DWD 1-like isoform X2 n=1 Tax=Vigna umbellata TaxID=87088 RepID=UPI001F5E78E0|nr:protein HEAT STRESS TOLERANT DWD 1-like isoform X2 [Vigna umbellata]